MIGRITGPLGPQQVKLSVPSFSVNGMPAKRLLITLAKLAVSAALIAYLVYRAADDEQFGELVAGPKNWPLLALTLPLCLTAVTVTILRWHILVRALGLDFTVRDTLRAGFLGYLANLLPLGLVAGDSLKALALIHRNRQRKTEAVASVLVDRVLGLYALLLLAAIASLLLPAEQLARLAAADRALIVKLCWTVQAATLVSSVGLAVMLIPGVTQSRWWDVLERAPLAGRVLHKLVGAMRTYRRRVDLLLAVIGVSLVIHLCYAAVVVVMTQAIGIAPAHRPAIGSIFIIVPPSMIAGALPIGFYEVTITLLFRSASPPGAPPNMGLGRSEVRQLVHEARALPQPGELQGDEEPAPVGTP
jgi:uncharacterized protein (TIRG00374 family)